MAVETTTRQITWDGVPVTVVENDTYLQYGIELPPAAPLLCYVRQRLLPHTNDFDRAYVIDDAEPREVVERLLTAPRRAQLSALHPSYLSISERRVEIGFKHYLNKVPPIGGAVACLRDLAEGIAVAFGEQEQAALSQVGAAYRADVDSTVARSQALVLRKRVHTLIEAKDRRVKRLVRWLVFSPFAVITAILALGLGHC